MLIKFFSLCIVITLIVLARKARPASNKSGTTFPISYSPSTDDSNESTFTVATYNIQNGKNLEGARDISRSANAIKNADLVGIQEVCAPSYLNKLNIGETQAESLAKVGRFNGLFCVSVIRWLREHRGNLILSKLDISNWWTQMLPDQSGKRYRNMTVAKVHWQNQTFHFINTHLYRCEGREEQLDIVLNELAKYPRAILVGDFNSRPNTPEIVAALKNIEITDAIGAVGIDSDDSNRVDWILTKGFKIHDAKMIERGISDHPYYQVNLSFL